MNDLSKTMQFRLVTPCFCRGADGTTPEMRIPSIRGELRYWHRLLWGAEATSAVWGGTTSKGSKESDEDGSASKIVLRLLNTDDVHKENCLILPHKDRSPMRQAICDKMVFAIQMFSRYGASVSQLQEVNETIGHFLAFGCLGLRGTRGYGAVSKIGYYTKDELMSFYGLRAKKITAYLSIHGERDAKSLLRVCSDTLSGADNERYFGYVQGNRRQTSPLKIKIVELQDGYHYLLWAQEEGIITGALNVLKNHLYPKPLGKIIFEKLC